MKNISHNKLSFYLLFLLLFFAETVIGQKEERLSEKFKDIAKPESTKGWIKFKEGAIKHPATIFEDYKDAFELSLNDKMIIKKIDKDKLGFNHFRFQQYYKNYPVLYGEYIVHQTNDGFVKSANGRLITGLNLGNTAVLPEKKALDAALHFMNAKKYLWQRSDMEKELKRQEKNANATYYPSGELVYAPVKNDGNFKTADYRLAWRFRIYIAEGNTTSKNVYVDAINGKIIYHTDISVSCGANSGSSSYNGPEDFYSCRNAKGYSLYNGNQHFKVHNLPNDSAYSLNDCQPTHLYVYDCNGGGAMNQFYYSAFYTWGYLNSAVQAQYGIAMTYKYFDSIHSRESWDDEAGDMIAYNEANIPGLGVNNSCWGCNGNTVMLGAGSVNDYKVTDDWNTLDIMGHEFMHGITQSTATLDYEKESGALNESFSDIFGEMVESIAQGSCDYLVGFAPARTVGPIRSFINPKMFGQPDTYLGTNWFNTEGCSPDANTNDNCGVHTNSGVQNHWFYLLSEGGSGVNDKGESYYVAPITYFKARYIAYRALVNYLNSDAQYIDARKASIEAAEDLFGSCSSEAVSVANAWHAVGVESQSSQYIKNVCGSYPASGTFEQALSALTAANGCTVEITPGATVYFTARDRVILNPGFTAYNGSNFIAYTSACSGTLFKGMILQPGAKDNTSISHNTEIYNKPDEQHEYVAAGSIIVYPNPFVSYFVVSIDSKENQKAHITLYNSVGTKVKERSNIVLVKGLNKITFDDANLAQGVYMVEINFGGSKTVKKIAKIAN